MSDDQNDLDAGSPRSDERLMMWMDDTVKEIYGINRLRSLDWYAKVVPGMIQSASRLIHKTPEFDDWIDEIIGDASSPSPEHVDPPRSSP